MTRDELEIGKYYYDSKYGNLHFIIGMNCDGSSVLSNRVSVNGFITYGVAPAGYGEYHLITRNEYIQQGSENFKQHLEEVS